MFELEAEERDEDEDGVRVVVVVVIMDGSILRGGRMFGLVAGSEEGVGLEFVGGSCRLG